MSYVDQFIGRLRVADTKEITQLLQRGIDLTTFEPAPKEILEFCLQYHSKYGIIPKLDILDKTFPETPAFREPVSETPLAALYDEILSVNIRQDLANLSGDINKNYQDEKNSGFTLLELMSGALQKLNSKYAKALGRIESFADMSELLKANYEATVNGTTTGMPIPFLFLQEELNGWQKSEITTVVAKTGVGKTWFLLMAAASAALGDPYIYYRPADKAPYSDLQRKAAQSRVLIVSFEMDALSIARRLAAVMTKTSFSKIKKGTLSTAERKSYYDALSTHAYQSSEVVGVGHNIQIIGPNVCITPGQIHAQAQEFNAALVLIDGFYTMEGPGEKRWERVESNMREMRVHTLLSPRHYILASQFRRDANSLKSSTNDEVAFSQSIAQDSNNMIALVQSESLRPAKQINIQLNKVRDGSSHKPFRYEWDFDLMRFSELGEENEIGSGATHTVY